MKIFLTLILIVLTNASVLWAFDVGPFREMLKQSITLTAIGSIALAAVIVVLAIAALFIGWICDNRLQVLYGLGFMILIVAVLVGIASKGIPDDVTLLGYPVVRILNWVMLIPVIAWIFMAIEHVILRQYGRDQ